MRDANARTNERNLGGRNAPVAAAGHRMTDHKFVEHVTEEPRTTEFRAVRKQYRKKLSRAFVKISDN
jgi:hypothetical protein